MSQHTCKPSPRAPSHHQPFGRSLKVHPIPEMDADLGKGDISQSYFTSNVNWTGGKQKAISSADTNSKERNSKKKLSSRLSHVRHIKVAPAPATELDEKQAKGDTPRPYMTDKVNWTGGNPALASASSLNTNKLEQTQSQQSRKSRYSLFHASSPRKKLDQAQHHRHKESTPSLPSISLVTNKPDQAQHQKYRENTDFGLPSTSSPDTNKSDQAQCQQSRKIQFALFCASFPKTNKSDQTQRHRHKESTHSSLPSMSSLDTNKLFPNKEQHHRSRESTAASLPSASSPDTDKSAEALPQRSKENTDVSLLSSSTLDTNKPDQVENRHSRKSRFSVFGASSPKTKKHGQAQLQRSKHKTGSALPSAPSPNNKPEPAQRQRPRKHRFSLFRASSPQSNKHDQTQPPKESTDALLLSASTRALDTNKSDQKQPQSSKESIVGSIPSATSPDNKPDQARCQRCKKNKFSLFRATSRKTNKPDRAQCQRSREITDTTLHSASSSCTTKPDQAQHKQSRKSRFPLFRRTSPSSNMTDQRSEEYIIYGEEDSTSKREVAECEVKKLKRACNDIKKAIDKKFPFHYSAGYKILMMLEPKLELQDLFDEERLVHEKLLTAKINLTEARSIELADKLVDTKNCIKFYKEEKRRISRGYSEETLLGIDIPDEFETRKQKEKFLTSEVQYFRKYMKAVEKEIRRLSDMKEMQILAKERHCYCFYCRK